MENTNSHSTQRCYDGSGFISDSIKECSICYDKLKTPITLECTHTFCYLCIKNYAMVAKSEGNNVCCPICRKALPINITNYAKTNVDKCDYADCTDCTDYTDYTDYIDYTNYTDYTDYTDYTKDIDKSKFYWTYQSLDGGWWYYEPSHNIIIETAFLKYMKYIDEHEDDDSESREDELYNSIEIEILQKIYVIDFDLVMQYPKNNPNLTRNIKRVDKYDPSRAKGVAGLRYT